MCGRDRKLDAVRGLGNKVQEKRETGNLRICRANTYTQSAKRNHDDRSFQ